MLYPIDRITISYMNLEEIRTLTIKAVDIFNNYSDDTHMGPEMKQIDIPRRKVEESMYAVAPNSAAFSTRYSNERPSNKMDKEEKNTS